MVKGCHHIGLYVNDTEKSLAFYMEGFDGTVARSFPIGPDKSIYLVEIGGGVVIELVPVGNAEQAQSEKWAHIALTVEDTQAAFEKLMIVGARQWMPPGEFVLGDVKAFLAYVYGPDGEIIELYQEHYTPAE